jgi:hypothetical protein
MSQQLFQEVGRRAPGHDDHRADGDVLRVILSRSLLQFLAIIWASELMSRLS